MNSYPHAEIVNIGKPVLDRTIKKKAIKKIKNTNVNLKQLYSRWCGSGESEATFYIDKIGIFIMML